MFKGTFKDVFTNIVSLVLAVASAIQVYLGTLGGGEIDWFQLLVTVAGAVVAWLTGKAGNGKPDIDV